MNIDKLIVKLEFEWDTNGFLGRVRRGVYDIALGEDFHKLLHSIELQDDTMIPKRLLSLLWYLPIFLEWQKDRVNEVRNGAEYEEFVTQTQNILEHVLGVP